MGKLHQLLAVEPNLKAQYEKARADLGNTFEKKRHHFTEKRVVFTPYGEDQKSTTEEQQDIQTSIRKELDWLAPMVDKALDASLRIAETNCKARADVALDDGRVLYHQAPATALLDLEKRAIEIRALVDSIPTLDPARGFMEDHSRKDTFIARMISKIRTKKTVKPVVLYPATVEHPAQVQLVPEDAPVGVIEEMEWSSLITPARKADMMARADEVIRAIKAARSRANDAEVDESLSIGQPLTDYIFIRY